MWRCPRTGRVSRGLPGWLARGWLGWVLAGPVGWPPAFGDGAAGGLAAGGAAEACRSSGGGGVDRHGAPLAGADRHGGLVLTGFVTWDGHETRSLRGSVVS